MPPPISRIGAESSMALMTAGSELNVAVSEPMKPNDGVDIQMMSQGNSPRTRKTAIKIPQRRNHLWARLDMVRRTSALMTALSIDETISKMARPRIIRMALMICIRSSGKD